MARTIEAIQEIPPPPLVKGGNGWQEDFLADEVRLELMAGCGVAMEVLGFDWHRVWAWLERAGQVKGRVAIRLGLVEDWARVALAKRLATELEERAAERSIEVSGVGHLEDAARLLAAELRALAAGER